MTPELVVLGIIALALVAYVLGGGADFGAGLWDLLARGPRKSAQRELIENEIGPVWEANHVWFIFVFVVLFTGFPSAFTVITSGLFTVLTIYAVGLVLRGTAFTFRHYDSRRALKRPWGIGFSVASLVCPFLLGFMGALLLRAAPLDEGPIDAFTIASGAFVVALVAALAASYLAVAARDPELARDFRLRTRAALIAAGVLSVASLAASRGSAPRLLSNDPTTWLHPMMVGIAPICGLLALALLWKRRDRLARIFVALTATSVVVLWGLAMGSRLAPPTSGITSTIATTKAHEGTLWFLIVASALGGVLLVPSIAILFRVFHQNQKEAPKEGSS